jgi:hypothetical protein
MMPEIWSFCRINNNVTAAWQSCLLEQSDAIKIAHVSITIIKIVSNIAIVKYLCRFIPLYNPASGLLFDKTLPCLRVGIRKTG